MTQFLNLFSAYREAVEARIHAEDEARWYRTRADKAEERAQALQDELLATHKTLNDKLGQKFLGTRFWTEPDPIERSEHTGVPSRSRSAQSAIREIESQSLKNLKGFLNGDSAAS